MLEPPWAELSCTHPHGRSSSILFRAGCCTAAGWVNGTGPSWSSPAAHLPTASAASSHCSWCSSSSAGVIQHSWEMAISGDTQTSSVWRNVFSHCSEQHRLSCCKQQTRIHAGRPGRSVNVPGSNAAGTQTQMGVSSTTKIQQLNPPKPAQSNKIGFTKPGPAGKGRWKDFWMRVKWNNTQFILTGDTLWWLT